MKSRDPVGAASATYRKVVNRVAKTLRVPPNHTRYPSDDFVTIAGLIDTKAEERALQWYKRGIRRGFIEACDALLDGQLELNSNTLTCPSKVAISVRVKFRGGKWQHKTFRFIAIDLGFK